MARSTQEIQLCKVRTIEKQERPAATPRSCSGLQAPDQVGEVPSSALHLLHASSRAEGELDTQCNSPAGEAAVYYRALVFPGSMACPHTSTGRYTGYRRIFPCKDKEHVYKTILTAAANAFRLTPQSKIQHNIARLQVPFLYPPCTCLASMKRSDNCHCISPAAAHACKQLHLLRLYSYLWRVGTGPQDVGLAKAGLFSGCLCNMGKVLMVSHACMIGLSYGASIRYKIVWHAGQEERRASREEAVVRGAALQRRAASLRRASLNRSKKLLCRQRSAPCLRAAPGMLLVEEQSSGPTNKQVKAVEPGCGSEDPPSQIQGSAQMLLQTLQGPNPCRRGPHAMAARSPHSCSSMATGRQAWTLGGDFVQTVSSHLELFIWGKAAWMSPRSSTSSNLSAKLLKPRIS